MLGFERRSERKKAVKEAELIVSGYYEKVATANKIAKIVAEDEGAYQSGIDRLSETHPLDRRVTFLVPLFVAESVGGTIANRLRRMRWDREYPIEEGVGASLASIFRVAPNEDGNVNIDVSIREMNEINSRLEKEKLQLEPATLILNENFASANDGSYARNYIFNKKKAHDRSSGW